MIRAAPEMTPAIAARVIFCRQVLSAGWAVIGVLLSRVEVGGPAGSPLGRIRGKSLVGGFGIGLGGSRRRAADTRTVTSGNVCRFVMPYASSVVFGDRS